MAKMTDVPDDGAYSSGVKKTLILGKDGKNMASPTNPLPVDANVTPESSKYVPDAVVNTTNLAATTHYFPSSTGMEMGPYNHLSIGGELIDADGNITLSVEVANNSDPATAVWHQIYGYDMINNTTVNQQAVASGTTSYFMDFEALNVTHVRFKVICSGATNTVKVMARRKV